MFGPGMPEKGFVFNYFNAFENPFNAFEDPFENLMGCAYVCIVLKKLQGFMDP